jgi:tRNA(Ile)-lysidine synthetase-like protein
MIVNLPKPGKYVVAVSGGVDSICLLNIMAESSAYDLVVAHFDHGIRTDSRKDRLLVSRLAQYKQIKFVSQNGNLGRETSESLARQARYDFLYQVLEKENALAIVTAHHLDDRLETLIINLIRGTGRLGLGSICETATIKRPFLNLTKAELKSYAHQHNLSWREDSTNQDCGYLRNYLRLKVIPRLSDEDKAKFIRIMDRQVDINIQIDQLIGEWLEEQHPARLNKKLFNNLSYNESKELIAFWLRYNKLVNFNHQTIERLTLGAKTKPKGAKLDVYDYNYVVLDKDYLALRSVER